MNRKKELSEFVRALLTPGGIYKMEIKAQEEGTSMAYSPRAGRMATGALEVEKLLGAVGLVYLVGRYLL